MCVRYHLAELLALWGAPAGAPTAHPAVRCCSSPHPRGGAADAAIDTAAAASAPCRGVDYSFASEPQFDIRANPVGLAASADLPGIVGALRMQLLKVGCALSAVCCVRGALRWHGALA